ncbi:hypothetical protein [Nitrosomonas halophila]|uniref:N-acetyltransferase domain-containing protein n=1 Tax=Nitrosomonas halophila TaxID=44576 RepID=A0A1H3H961_9PROT|nr:hypothetical protein [Nitrosomonas halophila]SDY11314.1 hypothetical protein SAMN05421881_101844 [Nitrosomonas halophila]
MNQMLHNIKKTSSELGIKDTLLYIFDRLLYKISFKTLILHKYYITQQPVSQDCLVPAGKGGDIEIAQIGPDHPLLQQMDRPFSVLQKRFANGGHCFSARKGEQFAGNLWLNFDKYQEDEVRCTYVLQPKGQAAWDYDVFVLPKYRFSYVFAKLWDEANKVMRQRGIGHVYSRINYYNIASLQAHKRLGSRIIGSLFFINLGRFQCAISLHFKPTLTFSLNRDVFPEVHIGATEEH